MSKIYLTKGLPASGKTTWAEDAVLKSDGTIININKDDLQYESLFVNKEVILNSSH